MRDHGAVAGGRHPPGGRHWLLQQLQQPSTVVPSKHASLIQGIAFQLGAHVTCEGILWGCLGCLLPWGSPAGAHLALRATSVVRVPSN